MITEPPLLPSILDRMQSENRALWLMGVLFAGLWLLFGLAALFDQRQVLGINPWIKPMKFAASISIYAFTLAWLLLYSDWGARPRFWFITVVTLTMVLEMAIIGGQAARGQLSHFNISTPLNGALFSLMGVMIALNTVAVASLMLGFWGQPAVAGMPTAFLWSIRLGLLIFVLASLEGFMMVSRMGHTVGAADGGAGLPFLNWSTVAGDLRVAHFFGMHALQVLPLLTLLLLRVKPDLSVAAVLAISGVYMTAFFWLVWRALQSIPFYRL